MIILFSVGCAFVILLVFMLWLSGKESKPLPPPYKDSRQDAYKIPDRAS